MAVKAVIYARVSTDGQDTSNQLAALDEWANAQDLEVVCRYVEPRCLRLARIKASVI